MSPALLLLHLLLTRTSKAELKVEDYKNGSSDSKKQQTRSLDLSGELSAEDTKKMMELLNQMKKQSEESDKLIKELDKEL